MWILQSEHHAWKRQSKSLLVSRSATDAATVATQNGYVATLRNRRNFLRLYAIQRRYVATFPDPKKACCDHCVSNCVCCDFARPNYLREFARPKTGMLRLCATQKCMLQPLRLKMGMLQLCATKTFARPCATQNSYVAFSRVEVCDLYFDRHDQ